MTPLPRGAVGKWMGWGLGVSALELARRVGGWAADEKVSRPISISHSTHSLNQGTPAPTCRGWVWSVISRYSAAYQVHDRCGCWALGSGCWMLATWHHALIQPWPVARRTSTLSYRQNFVARCRRATVLVDIVGLIDLRAIDRGPWLTSHLLQSAPGWVGTRMSRCPARSAPPPRRCDTQKHEACACPTLRGPSHALPPPWQAPKPSKHSRSYIPPTPPSVPPSSAGPSPAPCAQRYCGMRWGQLGRRAGVSANLGLLRPCPLRGFNPPGLRLKCGGRAQYLPSQLDRDTRWQPLESSRNSQTHNAALISTTFEGGLGSWWTTVDPACLPANPAKASKGCFST